MQTPGLFLARRLYPVWEQRMRNGAEVVVLLSKHLPGMYEARVLSPAIIKAAW